MLNNVNSIFQGSNSQCYPIYSGVTSNTAPNANTTLPINPLTNVPVTYVLVGNNTLYKRNSNGNGYMFKQMTTPFLFYNVNSELICLIGFNSQQTPTTSAGLLSTTATVTPISSTTYTNNGTTSPNSTVQTNANLVTVAIPPGSNPQIVANSINTVATLSAPAPSGVSLNANVVRLEPSASYSTIVQLRDSQLYVGPLQVNGLHRREPRNPVSMFVHARGDNKSIVSAGDVGAYTAGNSTNCSVLHSDNYASHIHAFARENSKVLSLGIGSTAAGESSCGSIMSAGGVPNLNNPLYARSRYRLMTVGLGVVQHRGNIYSLSGNSRCPTLDTLLENSTPYKSIPPISCQVCTDISTGEHAPGSGHGSIVHGVATTNSLIQTSGDGASAFGVADCNETHVALGRGSMVQGRNNIALSPYSQALGQNSVAHMYGQSAQGIRGSYGTNVSGACDVSQSVKVVTRSHVDCSPVISGNVITGFLLYYRMVLGNNPLEPRINTPDGMTVTNYALPSLVCPGVAKVDVQLSSPAITNSMGVPYADGNSDAYAADYCFYVQRTDVNQNQSCHLVIPNNAPVPIVGSCQFSPSAPPYFFVNGTPPSGAPSGIITPILEADLPDNLCGGFTILFTEYVPITSPRIAPTPTTLNTIVHLESRLNTTFQVLARIMCATFEWTQAPSGFTRVACVPHQNPPSVGITVPAYTAVPVQHNCPTTTNNNNNGNGGTVVGANGITCVTNTQGVTGSIYAGNDFTVIPDSIIPDVNTFNMIQDLNNQFASH
jgi:hypothetical protein